MQTGVLPGAPDKPDEAISTEYEEAIEETEQNDFGKRTRQRIVKRDGLLEHARKMSPKLRAVSNQKLGRYLGDRERGGCSQTWIKSDLMKRDQRGWHFPSLAQCRDRWVERFPNTVWPDGSPADWTFGGED